MKRQLKTSGVTLFIDASAACSMSRFDRPTANDKGP